MNKAVVQMDEITQQNASLVEEASAASQSMSAQAKDLRTLCTRFKCDQNALELAQKEITTFAQSTRQVAQANGTTGRRAARKPALKIVNTGKGFDKV